MGKPPHSRASGGLERKKRHCKIQSRILQCLYVSFQLIHTERDLAVTTHNNAAATAPQQKTNPLTEKSLLSILMKGGGIKPTVSIIIRKHHNVPPIKKIVTYSLMIQCVLRIFLS
jgi:hypothetical protein